MFDNHHRVAALCQPLQNIDQLVHIGKMQARGGLVQNVDGLSGTAPGQLRGQLDSLGLAAGQRGGRLAQTDVGQAHIVEGFDLSADGGQILEEGQRLLHRHVQHVINALALIFHLQRLPVVTLSVADLAGYINIRQEMHLDLDDSVAAAGLAPASFYVEAEAPLLVTPGLGVRGGREQIPDLVKHPRVGGRIGPGRSSDGRLVDVDYLVQLLHAQNLLVIAGNGSGMVQRPRQALVKNLVDQGAFPGTGYAGDAGKYPQRKLHVDIFQVILGRPLHRQPSGGLLPLRGHRNLPSST